MKAKMMLLSESDTQSLARVVPCAAQLGYKPASVPTGRATHNPVPSLLSHVAQSLPVVGPMK